MRRPPPTLLALVAGLCLAASVPPWGFWPLALVGVVLLDRSLMGATGVFRLGRAWLVWAALLFPSMFWMRALTAPGYIIASVAYAGFLAIGTVLAPRGPGRFLAIPGGVILAEWVRWRWPFGGVPLSNLALGQVAGPLWPMLRLGGALFLVGMTVVAGMAVAAALDRRPRVAAGLAAFCAAVLVLGVIAPAGEDTGQSLEVALVQGGGPQGTRAADTVPGIVLERHLEATADLDREVDLLIWPEDVVDAERLAGSPEEETLQDVAVVVDAVFVAGVIEDDGDDGFRNWAVVYDAEGREVDRYEKVERVPFGEWVPLRDILEPIAGDALPARDARVGTGPAVVDTPHGRLGVSISWEIFFGERARDATTHGAELLINPTNGASFEGTQVQTQQIASSRIRAIENGRWVTQVAPTGFSAVIDPRGDVRQRTSVSEREILYDTVELRTGRTVYARVGDQLALVLAALGIALGWLLERRGPWIRARS